MLRRLAQSCCTPGPLAVFFLAAVLLPPLKAQMTASIRGTVKDEQGAVLPNVMLSAREVETNSIRSTVTGDVGQYYLPNLPPGTYKVRAELTGFAPVESDVELTIGREFELNLSLHVASLHSEVTVNETVALVDTQQTVGEDIGIKQIEDLPTITRDISGLAKLAPGVTVSNYSGTNAGTGYSFGGQRQYENNIVVDGATNVMQFYGRQANFFPQDWIQEFQVLTNSYPPEYGQSAGGVLNVVTRSGTNDFHGRIYGYFRDAALDAPPYAGHFVNGQPQFLNSTPPYSQQRMGAYLGGPIIKDKLFFFGGYEYQNLGSTTVLGISPFWISQGVQTVIPVGQTQHAAMGKVDWNINSSNRFSFRYTDTVLNQTNQSLNGSSLDTLPTRYSWGGPLWNMVAEATSTLSADAFNEFRAYYGINKPFITCNLADAGGAALLAKAPLGTYAPISYPGANFGCTGFTGLEGEGNLTLTDNFSWIKGHHRLKFGVQLQRLAMYMNVEASQGGTWSFLTDSVFNTSNPSSYPSSYTLNLGTGIDNASHWNPGVFFQDSWQVLPNLVLNIGARYDIDFTIVTGNNFVNSYNARIVACCGGTPPLQETKPDYRDLAPRAGFVWTPTADKRTSIHGGFGMFFDQNHFNYNDIYLNETLLSNRKLSANCFSPTANPFWTQATPAIGEAQCQAFLASNFPFPPNLNLLPTVQNLLLGLDRQYRDPYTTQMSIGVEHDFAAGIHVQANYVHTQGHGILVEEDTNLAQSASGQYFEKDPRFSAIDLFEPVGWIKYNGLQTGMTWRKSRLTLGASYTLSKATSNTVTNITGGAATNPLNLNIDVGPDNSDRRHNFVGNVAYALPWGFEIASIGTYRSPLPYSITNAKVVYARVAPRNNQRGDSEKDMDLRFSKVFRIRERMSAKLYWEIYNVLNNNNWISYTGNQLSSTFGFPTAELPKRQQQAGFEFNF